MDEHTLRQLAMIAEIGAALDGAGIAWWLFGGWAVDFHAGSITRDHADIEVFVRLKDAGRLNDAMRRAGFAAPAPLHPDEGQPFLRDGQEAGVFFLVQHADGRSHTPGRWADWPWRAGAFDGPRLRLDDVEAPVMSAEGLLDMKLNFAAHPYGAPLRDKDQADITVLRGVIAGSRTGA
jgi:aminoglycoside-2''-adenylyltransferase